MEFHFSKYEGSGNDFVAIDMTSSKRQLTADLIRRICEEKRGVGADGILVLEESHLRGCVYRLVHYEKDASDNRLCGNASLCSLAFAEQMGVTATLQPGTSELLFEAVDGVHKGSKLSPGVYCIEIKDVPLRSIQQIDDKNYSVDTGTAHHVRFVDDVDKVNVLKDGRDLRWSTDCNVDFVQVDEQNVDSITVRTFERGVEDETLACGTGSAASAIAAFLRHHHDFKNSDTWNGSPTSVTTRVSMRGGLLKVAFTVAGQTISDIRLSGNVRHVFDGIITL